MNAGIDRDGERLFHQNTVADESDLILARCNERTNGLLARRVLWDGVVRQRVFHVVENIAEVTVIESGRRIVVQVPDETVESDVFRERGLRAEPVVGYVFRSLVFRRCDAGEAAD